ncbi:MAG: hypothetical protein H0X67_09985 [Acidobacteria bacterium]|nr:hypothetical protein [Acidobacteriota bacterium]
MRKHYRRWNLVDRRGRLDYDADDSDMAEWGAYFEMMDVAAAHWDARILAWLRTRHPPRRRTARGARRRQSRTSAARRSATRALDRPAGIAVTGADVERSQQVGRTLPPAAGDRDRPPIVECRQPIDGIHREVRDVQRGAPGARRRSQHDDHAVRPRAARCGR